jgi:propanol-preferring alcohol dehydrogenase
MAETTARSQWGYRIHRWREEPNWEEFPLRPPATGEAEVRVQACGVGLTVLNCIAGSLSDDPSLLPRVPGHEIAGVVTAVGSEVSPDLIGRRVVAYFYLSCGTCPECAQGEDSRCRRLGGWVGVHRDGGYAPYTVLPVSNLIPIPEELDPVSATVVPDAVATPVHVAERAGIGEGDRVVVVGAGGGVGIHMIQVAAMRGAQVVGLDVTAEKLEEIETMGARAVDSTEFSALGSLFDDGPPTVVVDLLGSIVGARWAIDELGTGGRLISLTTFRDRPVPFESRELVFRELSLLGSRYARKREVEAAARLVATGQVKAVIGEVTGPDGLLELHDRLRSHRLVGRGALVWSEG